MSALLPTYAPADIVFERGEGAWLYDKSGSGFLDFGSGIAVNSLGHCHPHLVSALVDQARKLWHVSNLVRIEGAERLAARLVEATFADKVFFANSGAEANECAIKMARNFHATEGRPERYRILTFEGAFHGRTLATLAAGGQRKHLANFGPKVDGFDQVSLDDDSAVEAWIGPESAAFMVEPILGEGGVRVVDPGRLRRLRTLADRHGLVLIIDEVQTGVGRTGRFCAHEEAGVAPDILTLAKGVGGGFPLGACLASNRVSHGMTAGSHGSTFGGNPLATACGNAVLDVVLGPGFLDDVRRKAEDLRRGLLALKDEFPGAISEVRGLGFLLGLQLKVANGDAVVAARREGLLVVAGGDNVVRILPPLTIESLEISEGLRRLEATFRRIAADEPGLVAQAVEPAPKVASPGSAQRHR